MIDIKIKKIIATPYNCGKSFAVSAFGHPVSCSKRDECTDIIRVIYDYDHGEEFRALHSKPGRQRMMLIGLLSTIEEIVKDRLNSHVSQATIMEFEIVTHLHVDTINRVIEEMSTIFSVNEKTLFKQIIAAFKNLTIEDQWTMRPPGSDPREYNVNQFKAMRRKKLGFGKCLEHYNKLDGINKTILVGTIFEWLTFNQVDEKE